MRSAHELFDPVERLRKRDEPHQEMFHLRVPPRPYHRDIGVVSSARALRLGRPGIEPGASHIGPEHRGEVVEQPFEIVVDEFEQSFSNVEIRHAYRAYQNRLRSVTPGAPVLRLKAQAPFAADLRRRESQVGQ